ncbi:MAG TPA: hypothetical protein VL860_04030 [Planctomycetota bacterium]|nr:hypothetical protein [Planctomycetota bacterium]
MLKFWQNMKLSNKIALFVIIILIALVAGWFSDFIPGLILNHYRSEYTAMAKDKDTGFPSYKDRTESGGMGAFITLAFWYDMAQQRAKARECYLEALYRYGWDHPRAAEVWVDLMEGTFHGANADTTEQNAVLFYWLFAGKYNDKYAKKGESFTFHPGFKEYEPVVRKMVASRGSRVLLPVPEKEYDLDFQVLLDYKDRGARAMLMEFINVNNKWEINAVDKKAMGSDEANEYIPNPSKINEFSIKDWQ